jgi:hypothetical protein
MSRSTVPIVYLTKGRPGRSQRAAAFERSEDVLALQIGVVSQQLVDASDSGKLAEHHTHGDAGVADAGQAAHPVWVYGDSLFDHVPRIPRHLPIIAAAGSMQGGIGTDRRASAWFQALIRSSAWNNGDMRGWFHLVSATCAEPRPAHMQGIHEKAADGIRTHDLLHGN